MNTKFRKFVAATMTACAICSIGVLGANAAGKVYDDGAYTAKAATYASGTENPSMSNGVFDQDADLVIAGGLARLTLYVPYNDQVKTMPGCENGAITNLRVTLGETDYIAESDLTTLPVREYDADYMGFFHAGDQLPSQRLTVSFPAALVEQLEASAPMTMHVNPVMNMDVSADLRISNVTKAGAQATETSQQSLQLTANVAEAVAEPSYSLRIPQSLDLGTLSATEDTIKTYEVSVTAENLGSGKVVVTAETEGALQSGSHSLAFTNTLPPISTGVSATAEGTITVTAAAVAAAAAGNYQGTANFTANYFAGK